jgi:hypothetical protein
LFSGEGVKQPSSEMWVLCCMSVVSEGIPVLF